MKTKKITLALTTLLLAVIIYPKPALAYIDPGSGSYMIQIFFASLIGISLSFRTILKKIKEFLAKRKKK